MADEFSFIRRLQFPVCSLSNKPGSTGGMLLEFFLERADY